MKKEELFDAIGEIDARFVEEGWEEVTKKKVSWNRWMKIGLAAAAVLIAAGTGLSILSLHPVTKTKAPIEKHVALQDDSADEVVRAFRWEEMPDVQRYSSLAFADRSYRTKLIYVHPEDVGEVLGTGTLTGQDAYTEEIHTLEGKVTKIAGIDAKAAVAVFFPGEPDRGYAYANADYTPATLGAFINDLDLRNTLKTGLVYASQQGSSPDIVYEDIPQDLVWEMLLSDVTLLNEPEHQMGRKVISIAASIDVIGYHYKTITLTEDGYLMTNLLETGKYFNIGKDKVDAFLKEVTENHQGYIYIYDSVTEEFDE